MVASQELLDALQGVDAAFQGHLDKPEQLCVSCEFSKRGEPDVAAQLARFEKTYTRISAPPIGVAGPHGLGDVTRMAPLFEAALARTAEQLGDVLRM